MFLRSHSKQTEKMTFSLSFSYSCSQSRTKSTVFRIGFKITNIIIIQAPLGSESIDEFLVSKETVVLRQWERSKQKFGFIKQVDKG